MKKTISVIIAVLMLVSMFAGCGAENKAAEVPPSAEPIETKQPEPTAAPQPTQEPEAESTPEPTEEPVQPEPTSPIHEEYLASLEVAEEYWCNGTVPSSAKIYPVANNNMTFHIVDEYDLLTDEDIWKLLRYVDLYAGIDDTRGEFPDKELLKEFIDEERVEKYNFSGNTLFDYKIEAVQPFLVHTFEDGHIEFMYIVVFNGCNVETGLEEGRYEYVASARFWKDDNGTLYNDAIQFQYLVSAGGIEYAYDLEEDRYNFVLIGEQYPIELY